MVNRDSTMVCRHGADLGVAKAIPATTTGPAEHIDLDVQGLLTVIFFTALFFSLTLPDFDSDFWWHLANGRWIWESRSFPLVDSFDFMSKVFETSPSPLSCSPSIGSQSCRSTQRFCWPASRVWSCCAPRSSQVSFSASSVWCAAPAPGYSRAGPGRSRRPGRRSRACLCRGSAPDVVESLFRRPPPAPRDPPRWESMGAVRSPVVHDALGELARRLHPRDYRDLCLRVR